MTKKIELGDVFGFWEVKEVISSQYLNCLCTGCNKTTRKIRKWTLLRGDSKSCGCQIKNIMKETNQTKYGVDFVQQNQEIKEKSKGTLREKYGEDNAMKVEEFQKKSRYTRLAKKAAAKGGLIFGVDKYIKV